MSPILRNSQELLGSNKFTFITTHPHSYLSLKYLAQSASRTVMVIKPKVSRLSLEVKSIESVGYFDYFISLERY